MDQEEKIKQEEKAKKEAEEKAKKELEKKTKIAIRVHQMKSYISSYCDRTMGVCSSSCENCMLEVLVKRGYQPVQPDSEEEKAILDLDLDLDKIPVGHPIWVGEILKNNSTEARKGSITKIEGDKIYYLLDKVGTKEAKAGQLNKDRYKKINDYSSWFCLTGIELDNIMEIFKELKDKEVYWDYPTDEDIKENNRW